MPKDILDMYGEDSSQPQEPRATSGGMTQAKPLPYSPPKGPIGIGHCGPGLGGDNYGNGQKPICREDLYGSPGLKGMNHGTRGSQK